MSDSLDQLSFMWTEENYDYWLVGTNDDDLSIYKVSEGGFITIEDNDLFLSVVKKLMTVGTRRITDQEYSEYLSSRASDGSDLIE